MAAFLKRKHELIALKVFLEFDQRMPWVRALLESHEGGTPNFPGEWRFSVSELGLPRHFNPREVPSFVLPEFFGSRLASS
jgi:hypothetical protein